MYFQWNFCPLMEYIKLRLTNSWDSKKTEVKMPGACGKMEVGGKSMKKFCVGNKM